jgi:ABC-2 type transport system permease protein
VSDAWTVARKELTELLGDRSSRRGALVQAILVIIGLGILVPRSGPQEWLLDRPEAILLFLLLPPVIAGTIGADSFAGERERKTLETLLATPLSDRAVVAGKAMAALGAATVVAVISLIAAVTTVNVMSPAATFVPSLMTCAGALIGAFASSCVTTALAIALSLRAQVARAVQQVVSHSFQLPALLGGYHAQRHGFSMTWSHQFELEGVALAVGLAGLAAAAARFGRERLFATR